MDAGEIVKNLRDSIVELKRRGSHFVTVPQLERWADTLEKDISASIEHLKLDHATAMETYKGKLTVYMESYKGTIDAGREALKVVVMINGGAAVVLIGFLGAVASRSGVGPLGVALTEPLAAFGQGLICGAVGFGARYFAQGFYTAYDISRRRRLTGAVFNVLSIILTIAAYAYFGCGLWSARAAFVTHFEALPEL